MRRRKRLAKDRSRGGVLRRSESKDEKTRLEIWFCMKHYLGFWTAVGSTVWKMWKLLVIGNLEASRRDILTSNISVVGLRNWRKARNLNRILPEYELKYFAALLIQGREGTYIVRKLSRGTLTTVFQMCKFLMFYTTLTECSVNENNSVTKSVVHSSE